MKYTSLIKRFVLLFIVGSIVGFAYFHRFSYLTPTTNSIEFRYDTVRSKLLEQYDTLFLEDYPLPTSSKLKERQVEIKPSIVIAPVSNKVRIPKDESTLLDNKYLAYKFNIYKRVGFNPKTGIYEGIKLSKGTIIRICNTEFKFTNNLVVVRGCFLENAGKQDNCTKLKVK